MAPFAEVGLHRQICARCAGSARDNAHTGCAQTPTLATLSALCLGQRSSLTETADMRKLEATTIINPVSTIGIREPSVSTTDLAHAVQRLTPLQQVRSPSLTPRWSRTQG